MKTNYFLSFIIFPILLTGCSLVWKAEEANTPVESPNNEAVDLEEDAEPAVYFTVLNQEELRARAETIRFDYYRIYEDSYFTYFFTAGNNEGEVVTGNVYIKDKNKPDTYLVSNHVVWDVVYDPVSKSFLMSVKRVFFGRYHDDNVKKEIEDFAKKRNMRYEELMKYSWPGNNMCGDCDAFNLLVKVDATTLIGEDLRLFAGEELALKNGKVLATQYPSAEGWYYCWAEIMPHSYDCRDLAIGVYEIDPMSLVYKQETPVKSIGSIHDYKDDFHWVETSSMDILVENLF